MSKAKWGGGTLFFLGLVANFLPVSDYWRWIICVLAFIGAAIWFFGYLNADDPKHGENKSVNISGQGMSGNVVSAGHDAIQSVHHYYSEPNHQMGIRTDASALREFKKLRDEGEKILSEIQPGDGDGGSAWGRIDSWWAEARGMAHRNVFRPFLRLSDITNFESSWPSQRDKEEAVKRASIAGQIRSGDDKNLIETHWQRLERVRELIGIIESRG